MPTLKEIRKDYPMYSDLSDGEFATAFHAKYYSDLPFQDFSKKVGYMKGANPAEYDSASPEFKARYGATSGMSGFDKFRAGMGKGMVDVGRGVGQAVGAVSRDDIAQSRQQDAALMDTGIGKVGNFAGTVAALAPTALIPGANTLAGAAAIGAGTGLLQPSTSTKETLTNGAVGGVLAPATMLAGRGISAAYRGGKAALWDPFTKGGQDRIAARTLEAFAGGSDEAAKAAQNIRQGLGEVMPGVQPTTAELAQNAGLSQLERTLKNNPEYMTQFAERASANRTAMTGALDNIAGDNLTREAATAARKATSGPLYEQATKANYSIDSELAGLLQRPVVKQAMGRAKTLAENQGRVFSFQPAANETMSGAGVTIQSDKQITGQGLQDLKMALDEMLTDPASGFTGKAGNTVKDLRGKIVSWMENANPAFKAARTSYRDLSKPLNQMEVGQALRDKLVPAMGDMGAGTRLNPSSFAKAIRDGDSVAAKATGMPNATLENVLSPEQMASVLGVGKQLGRRVNADELGKAVGSNTSQNIIGQNVVSQFLGPLGLPQNAIARAAGSTIMQSATRPLKFAGKFGEERAFQKLVEAGLDPELAAKILENAGKQDVGKLLQYQQFLVPAASGANASRQ